MSAMKATREPTEEEIANFLATRTSSQMLQIMRCIKEPAAQVAFTEKLLTITPVKQSVPPATTTKAKKALNAFVGFRCYYIAIPSFKQWPMKKLSNLIGVLWEGDPNKSLWSLMAKAWSNIRDQIGKEQAPLDAFFGIICPYLALPNPSSYLEIHGWTLIVNQEGDPTLFRKADSGSASVSTGNIDLALSVEDIIAYVQSFGYAPGFIPKANVTSSTFLGQSVSSWYDQNNPAGTTTEATSQIDEHDLAGCDGRSAKRLAAEDQEFKDKLQEEMDFYHMIAPSSLPDPVPEIDMTPFYKDLNNLISEHMAMEQRGATYAQDSYLFNCSGYYTDKVYTGIDDFVMHMPDPIDYDAFRLGANEDVALSTMDDFAHA